MDSVIPELLPAPWPDAGPATGHELEAPLRSVQAMHYQKTLFAILAASLLAIPEATAFQSLGEVARELRKAREKQPRQAVKVYTNDNIAGASHPEASPTASAQPAPAAVGPREAQAKTGPQTKKAIRSQEYWQARFRPARAALARAEEEQQLAQDELSLLQIQHARELDPGRAQELSGQVNAKRRELEAKHEAVRKAQKALDELNREFEKSGAPENWREPHRPG